MGGNTVAPGSKDEWETMTDNLDRGCVDNIYSRIRSRIGLLKTMTDWGKREMEVPFFGHRGVHVSYSQFDCRVRWRGGGR